MPAKKKPEEKDLITTEEEVQNEGEASEIEAA